MDGSNLFVTEICQWSRTMGVFSTPKRLISMHHLGPEAKIVIPNAINPRPMLQMVGIASGY